MNGNELIFVVMEGQDDAFTAIESNVGIVVFGERIADIRANILLKVQEHFKGEFKGTIRIRQFRDIVITL